MNTTSVETAVDNTVARWGPSTLRWMAALLWLSNVSWKVPPDFGKSAGGGCSGLCGYVNAGSEHLVFPGAPWLFEHLVAPNLTAFGWITLFVETSLVVMLVSGRYLRIAGVLGIAQSLGIMAAVANADGEWYWSYLLMIGLHLAILVTAPTIRRPHLRSAGFVTIGYGVVVAIAHITAGFTGDGNKAWTLFGARNDIPGDFGKNVFPGSIALGLLLIALGVAALLLHDRLDADITSRIGLGLVALATFLLLTYDKSGLLLGLGSKASTAAMIGALGLVMARPHERLPAESVGLGTHATVS